jgi:hypothetical protein
MLKIYRGRHPLQNYRAIRKNPVAFLSDVLKECGDFAFIRIFTFRFYLINDPNLIRETLIEKNDLGTCHLVLALVHVLEAAWLGPKCASH